MSDLIIKIGDDALDLSNGQTIAITKQSSKVGDFSTVLADGTNEVTVPLTARNRLIIDNAHLVQSDSPKPYGRIDATLIQEGYQTIQDGYAIIKSSADNFSVQVVGGNASFFNRIKDLNLRDLPLGEYDHFWTNQEVFDRRNETEGLIYAVFEQGLNDNTMRTYGANLYAVETDILLPSFYIKTLIGKIFEAQGYTFITDLTGEDIYDKAVVFRGKIPNRGNDMSYHNCTIRNSADYLLIDPMTSARSFPLATVETTTSAYANSSDLINNITSNGRFYLTDSCRITVSFEVFIDSTFSAPETAMYMDVFYTTSNGIVNLLTEDITVPFGLSTYSPTFTIDCSEFEGETYFYTKIGSLLIGGVDVLAGSTFTVVVESLLSNSVVTTSFPNDYITGALPVPDMKQGDFMKELARIYQWIFDTDERTQTVTARRFDSVKEQTINATDLSSKLHSKGIKINYGVDGFAQTNALRYKEDGVTKYDAVGYINVSDTTLNAEKDYVKMSQFAATSTRLRFGTVNAPYVPIFDEDLLPTNGMTDRLLLVRRVTFPHNVNFNRVTDIPTDDLTFAYFAEAGNEDSLDFPNLINRFYQTVIDMNDKGKSIECSMNLKIKDVVNYDPLTPVYIQHFGNYFYWEKLSNYVKGKLTKCKFIKI